MGIVTAAIEHAHVGVAGRVEWTPARQVLAPNLTTNVLHRYLKSAFQQVLPVSLHCLG